MNKILKYGLVGVVVLLGGFYLFNNYIYNEKQPTTSADYKNAEYVIEGEQVKLIDGVSEMVDSADSSVKTVTKYFGNELKTDLNNDGREDVVFLLTQETGGSGTFYYVVASLNTERGFVGSDGYFLGDRIAPQTTEVSQNPNHKNVIVVNYADRAKDEPMTTPPAVGKSVYLKLDVESMQWGIVEPDFSGEADPNRMTLSMKSWTWISALYNDGREIKPNQAGKFTITFLADGGFSVTTDCNSMGGSYTTDGELLTFGPIMSTKMYCEGSQESEFAELLQNTASYHFTSKGELVLDLKFDSGSVIFR